MSTTMLYGCPIDTLPGVSFGKLINASGIAAADFVERCHQRPGPLLDVFYRTHGLLVIRGLGGFETAPEQLLRLTQLFGAHVENYRETITTANFFHESVPEILVLSNLPPCNYASPVRPSPPLTQHGQLPLRYPHRRGWHTDQSYRRPPPDVSLLLGLQCPPADQGQTLYADGFAGYATLSTNERASIDSLHGIHALRFTGRSDQEVLDGVESKALKAHQLPQHHRLVRRHPVTNQPTLYLCDPEQMDFIDGPFPELATGPCGDGAKLLHHLLAHMTAPHNVYAHEWQPDDLVIHDNRNMLHTATWYDAAIYPRLMWRTTVMGNPGQEYAGVQSSWIPRDGTRLMQGLERLEES